MTSCIRMCTGYAFIKEGGKRGGGPAAESPDRHDAVDGLPITGRRAELSRWLDAAVTGPGQAKVVVERPGHQNNRPGM